MLATFTVNSTADTGSGSLREAIVSANNAAGPDTIEFDPSVSGTINLGAADGSLVITDAVTILGPGRDVLTVNAQATTSEFRVFDITDTAGDVHIDGLTISGGRVLTLPPMGELSDVSGGGIRFQSSGTLTIRNSTITGNTANNGGGIYSEFDGNVALYGSTLSDNTAQFGPGGGIHNEDGNTTIDFSIADNNTSYNSGGAVFSPYAGIVTITNSEITNNTVGTDGYHGGGVYSGGGDVTISGSVLTGNTAADDGGAVYNYGGNLAIKNSTIDNNRGGYSGAGIFNFSGNVSVTNSAVTNNVSLYGDGGGISNNSGNVTLTRSTVSGNQAVTDGGGLSNNSGLMILRDSVVDNNTAGESGGGIATISGPVTLTNSTVSTNSANTRGGGIQSERGEVRAVNSTITLNNAQIQGGGIGVIANDEGEEIRLHNSIVAANTSPVGPDFVAPHNAGQLEVRSSLIGDGGATNLTPSPTAPDTNGNFIGAAGNPINPQLGPLSENGGPTRSHSLSFASVASGGGSTALARDFGADGIPSFDDSDLTGDQRSGPFQRLSSGSVSMGAFEFQAPPFLTVDTAADVSDEDFSSGNRSLREWIEYANFTDGVDTIFFLPGLSSPITLDPALGPLQISDPIRIVGPGADQLVITKDPQDLGRLILVTPTAGDGGGVLIDGLALSGGNIDAAGGAILSRSNGDVALVRSEVTDNSAITGGGIASTGGSISIASSTLSGNDATGDGGAVAALDATSSVTLVNATISGNDALAAGGGLFSQAADVVLENSTLTLNTAGTSGGAIAIAAGGQTLDIDNSIVAGNTGLTGPDFIAPSNPATSLDVNASLIGNNAGTTLDASLLSGGVPQADADGNLVGGGGSPIIDPGLDPLGSSGGPTITHAPRTDSLAVGAGNLTLLPLDTFDLDGDGTTADLISVDQRGAARVTGTIEIGAFELAPPAQITWSDPADITFGTRLSSTQLNATADTAGTFEYDPGEDELLPVGNGQILMTTFRPDDPLQFGPATASVVIDVLKGNPLITWPDPAPITFGTLLSSTQLNATADVAGTFDYSPDVDAELNAGNHVLSVTFTPDDQTNFNIVMATADLVVNPADPVVNWADPDEIVFGTLLSSTQLNASSPMAGTFEYDPPVDSRLDAGQDQELRVTFTPDDPNFRETVTTVLIDVAKADPVITWDDPADIAAGTPLGNAQLNATADVAGSFTYTPAAGVVLPPGNGQTLSATFTPVKQNNFNIVNAEVVINVTQSLDFGDAPSSYPVTLADDGARHVGGSVTLGVLFDGENDGQPSSGADADGEDEDGVTPIASPVALTDSSTTASFMVVASGTGLLDAWFDFNGDGQWDNVTEKIADGAALADGTNRVSFTVPAGSDVGDTAARFRVSTNGGLLPTGQADDGEVEDYIFAIGDGTTPQVNLIGGTTSITVDGGNVTVSENGTTLFQAPADSLGLIDLSGDDSDNTVNVSLVEPLPSGLAIDGGDGTNTLAVSGSADLTSGGSVQAQSFAMIDLTNASDDQVTLDASVIAALSPTTNTVSIVADQLDQFTFVDATDWRMTQPRIDGINFIRIATNQMTGETVEFQTPNHWQNPVENSDINNDGNVTANDALTVIGELASRSFSTDTDPTLADATGVDPWPGTYYDQNGDGRITAIDALRAINRFAEISGEQVSEGESVAAPARPNASTDPDIDDARVAAAAPGQGLDSEPPSKLTSTEYAAESTADVVDSIVAEDPRESVDWADRVDEWLLSEME